MGFDVSSHPVDVGLIQSRVLPFLKGQGEIDDLVADAVRLAKVRFRANAWGLGLVALQGELASTPKKKRAADAFVIPESFDPDWHVWGRPFFITAPPGEVSATIDRYLPLATPEQVDALAMEQLHRLHPSLPNLVTPDLEGGLPDDDQLARGLREGLDFLRRSYPHIASGKPVKMPDGEAVDPEDLFLFHMPLAVLTFASHFRPGWMARGHVWFTQFTSEANLDADGLIESSAKLFEPLLQNLGGWEEAFEPTITQNYTLGGFVRAANVPAFRLWWEAHRDALMAPFIAEKDEATGTLAWQKILEALRDAELRKLAFLEATEVYSGFMGIMN
jgi:hypothetical protein